MRRRLFSILSALSLLLCLVTATIWVLGYWGEDTLFFGSSASGFWTVEESEGEIGLENVFFTDASWATNFSGGFSYEHGQASRLQDNYSGFQRWGSMGFFFLFEQSGPAQSERLVLIPWWFLVAAFALLPGAWVGSWRRRRLLQRGACAVCGYDLRATPEQCPECGTIVRKVIA